MPDDDTLIGQNLIDVRNEEHKSRVGCWRDDYDLAREDAIADNYLEEEWERERDPLYGDGIEMFTINGYGLK